MQITTKSEKESEVVKVSGRVDSHTAPQFEEALQAVTDAKRFKIILDASELEFLSSAGIRVLLAVQNTCKRFSRGELVFAAVPTFIEDTLKLAGLDQFFNRYDTVQEAVDSF